MMKDDDDCASNESEDTEGRGGRKYVILANCMHAGSRIVEVREKADPQENEDGGWEIEVLARFEEHKSMNYGSDVQPPFGSQGSKGVRRIVSTSFYDKLLCLWKYEIL